MVGFTLCFPKGRQGSNTGGPAMSWRVTTAMVTEGSCGLRRTAGPVTVQDSKVGQGGRIGEVHVDRSRKGNLRGKENDETKDNYGPVLTADQAG